MLDTRQLPIEQFLVGELGDADELDAVAQNHNRDLTTTRSGTDVVDGVVIRPAIVMDEFDDSTGGSGGFELIEELCGRLRRGPVRQARAEHELTAFEELCDILRIGDVDPSHRTSHQVATGHDLGISPADLVDVEQVRDCQVR